MAFDAQAFLQAKAAPRTQAVAVPDLAAFFPAGEEAVWTVRGLDSNELARANAAKESLARESALVEALAAGAKGEIVASLQSMLGRNPEDVEPDVARRMEILRAGSVDPPCPLELAVRIAATYPVVFFQLSNAILALTGQGSDVEKKPGGSGATAPCEPPPP